MTHFRPRTVHKMPMAAGTVRLDRDNHSRVRKTMPQIRTLQRCALRGAIATFTCLCAALAAAEPLATPPDEPVATEIEHVFDEPVDFSLPPPRANAGKIDGSKFTAPGAAAKGWDGKVGVDTGAPASLSAALRPEQLLAGAPPDVSSGIAWATVTAPADWPLSWDKAAIETRIDPLQQGKLGVTLSRSVPVGSTVALMWQNGHSVTQALGHGIASAGGSQVYSTNQAVRFTILPADTTLSVAATMSSTDDKWARSLSAEQKLFGGPVSITGAVSESPTGDISKSLKAGFKRTW